MPIWHCAVTKVVNFLDFTARSACVLLICAGIAARLFMALVV